MRLGTLDAVQQLTRAFTLPLTTRFETSFDIRDFDPLLYFDARTSMLNAGGNQARFLERVATFDNLTGGPDATHGFDEQRPRALPLIEGKGYLYTSGVNGNAPAVTFPTINANEDFVFEMEVYIDDDFSFHLASGASASDRFAVYNGLFYFSWNEYQPLASPLATGASTLTVERSGDTLRLKQDGVTKALKSSGVSDNVYNLTHLSFNGQFTTAVIGLRGYIKTATLSIEGTEELNIDFTDTSVAHGVSSFDCSTGQTVTINKTGRDPSLLLRRPVLRFDGAETNHSRLRGVFAGDVNTAHAFMKFAVNGDDFEDTAPATLCLHRTDHWLSNAANLYTGNGLTGTNGRTYIAATVMSQPNGWNDDNGSIVAEIKVSDGAHHSLINNANKKTDSRAYSLNSNKFRIAEGSTGGQAPLDLEQIIMFDRVVPEDDANALYDHIANYPTDPDALAYISLLESDGVSLTYAQKKAIHKFFTLGKIGGWYSLLKRFYLPIWGSATPNARCLVSGTSGTFRGAITHGNGFAHPTAVSGANSFNTNYRLLDDLTTESFCLMALAYDSTEPRERAMDVNDHMLGSGGTGSTGVRIGSGSSSARPQATCMGTVTIAPSGGLIGTHGVLLANRGDGATTLTRLNATDLSDTSVTAAQTGGTYSNLPISGFGSTASSYLTTSGSTDAKAGAFGISDKLTQSQRAAYAGATKDLWEACSGLTL